MNEDETLNPMDTPTEGGDTPSTEEATPMEGAPETPAEGGEGEGSEMPTEGDSEEMPQ